MRMLKKQGRIPDLDESEEINACSIKVPAVVDGKEITMTVKKGDKVVTGKYAGQELKLDGEDYVIVKMADILAVVE